MAYHYIIGVGVNDVRSNEPGELYLDSLFEFTDKDKENVNNCRLLSKDGLFKVSLQESATVFGCSGVITNFQGLLLRARVQNTMLLHYVSNTKRDRKFFQGFIKVTSIEELKNARIF